MQRIRITGIFVKGVLKRGNRVIELVLRKQFHTPVVRFFFAHDRA
jgi:hypothetical protein